jgi:hypothetical protein
VRLDALHLLDKMQGGLLTEQIGMPALCQSLSELMCLVVHHACTTWQCGIVAQVTTHPHRKAALSAVACTMHDAIWHCRAGGLLHGVRMLQQGTTFMPPPEKKKNCAYHVGLCVGT